MPQTSLTAEKGRSVNRFIFVSARTKIKFTEVYKNNVTFIHGSQLSIYTKNTFYPTTSSWIAHWKNKYCIAMKS